MKSLSYGCSLAMAILFAYIIMAAVEGPSDVDAAQAQYNEMQAAIKNEAAGTRFAKAAALLCGENAGYKELADGSVQCYTKRGTKTIKVAL
jgi:hypothetical protein